MIYPLLPVFLTGTLGASSVALGAIEGAAEATASAFKAVSGRLTDCLARRKPLILAGYGISSFARPLVGLAASWSAVLGIRIVDRIGKGLRSPPRDALIADVTPPEARGSAYGFHRSMDHAGAVLGPLLAAGLLLVPGVTLRHVFLLAAIPAVLAVATILFGLKEKPRPTHAATRENRNPFSWAGFIGLESGYRKMLLAVLVFTLGNSTDAFLLARLSQAGVAASGVAALWSAHHAVKFATTRFGGRAADRLGCRALIVTGWFYYSAIYFAFALVGSRIGLISAFLLYGVHHGLVEPAEKAWISRLVPAESRGTAFGYFHFTTGLAALPASVGFGLIWTAFGAPAAFATGAMLALLASAMLRSVPEKA